MMNLLRHKKTIIGVMFGILAVQVGAEVLIIKKSLDVLTVNGVHYEMVSIPGGTFQMGSNSGSSDEKPVHTVTISAFSMGKTEMTQGLWKAVMGNNPSGFHLGDNYPIESVSWDIVQTFIQKLNKMTGKRYRLPTEAEWEYACRAGTTGDSYGNIDVIAWNIDNSGYTTQPVGQKQPNAFGLYDMLGNVYEWCSDWESEYTVSSQVNPTGPSSGSYRANRGAGWSDRAKNIRSSIRCFLPPDKPRGLLGFRLASGVTGVASQ